MIRSPVAALISGVVCIAAAPPKRGDFEMVVQDAQILGVNSVAFSPDGRFYASGSSDQTVALYSAADGKLLRSSAQGGETFSIAFSSDSRRLAAGGGWPAPGIAIWNVRTGALERRISTSGDVVKAIAFAPGDVLLAASTFSGELLVLEVATGKIVAREKAHAGPALSVAISHDGRLIAGGGEDGVVVARDFPAMRSEKLRVQASGRVRQVAFSPDDVELAVADGGDNRAITLFRVADGSVLSKDDLCGLGGGVNSVAYSPDGNLIAGTSDYRVARIFRRGGGKVSSCGDAVHRELNGHVGHVAAIAFSADSKQVLTSANGGGIGTGDRSVRLWSVESGTSIREHEGRAAPITQVAVAADGRRLAVASGTTVDLWSLEEARLVRTLQANGERVTALALSRDETLLAYSTEDGSVFVWNASGEKMLAWLRTGKSWVDGLVLLPDGEQLVTATGKRLRVWRWATEEVTAEYELPMSIGKMVISSDGKMVAVKALAEIGGELRDAGAVFEVATGRELARVVFEKKNILANLTFSPDGRTLAVADGTALETRLYSLGGPKLLVKPSRVLKGATAPLAYTRNGRTLAAEAPGGGIELWDPATGARRGSLGKEAGVFSSLAFGDTVAVAGSRSGSKVTVWNLAKGESISLLALRRDWIIFSPDGYFDASREGGPLVAMVHEVSAFAVDQFALASNRPDLLLEKIWGKRTELSAHYREQYLRRLKRAGLTEDKVSSGADAPVVRIESSRVEGATLQLNLEISSADRPLAAYNIFAGDVPVFGAYGEKIEGRLVKVSPSIALMPGNNKIEISAMNDRGHESIRALMYANGPATDEGRDLYVLAFGVSKYVDPRLNLDYARKDAEDLQKAMIKMAGVEKGFRQVHAKIFVDEQVTAETIRGSAAFLKDARPKDTLVLYIAGHGLHDRDAAATYYYLTHDARLDRLSSTAIRFEDVEQLLYRAAARRKLFLMDTCESGEADQESAGPIAPAGDEKTRGLKARGFKVSAATGKSSPESPRLWLRDRDRFIYSDLIRRSGAIVFSSSRGGELSFERADLENGVFTEALLRAFAESDSDEDRDGLVDTRELQTFVAKLVGQITGDRQHPTVDRDNLTQRFGFPVGAEDPAVLEAEAARNFGPAAGSGKRLVTDWAGKRVRITNTDVTYPIINKGTCMTWPSARIKAKSGENAWRGAEPRNGDLAEVIAESELGCGDRDHMLILRLIDRDLYVAIRINGVERL